MRRELLKLFLLMLMTKLTLNNSSRLHTSLRKWDKTKVERVAKSPKTCKTGSIVRKVDFELV